MAPGSNSTRMGNWWAAARSCATTNSNWLLRWVLRMMSLVDISFCCMPPCRRLLNTVSGWSASVRVHTMLSAGLVCTWKIPTTPWRRWPASKRARQRNSQQAENMFLGIPQAAATLITIIIFYAMDFALIRRYDKQRRASGSGRAWDFTFFIFLTVAVLVLQPIFFPIISFRTTQTWGLFVQILGLILILDALALHIWSRVYLQHYYAERVEVQPEHKVIDTGPYALMKHPVITSFFGIASGLFLINPALTTLAALLYTIWDFTRAAQQEEDLLSRTLPGYAEYALRTPRFLPRLWRSR